MKRINSVNEMQRVIMRRKSSLSYLLGSIPQDLPPDFAPTKEKHQTTVPRDASKLLIHPEELTEKFRHPEYAEPSKTMVNRSQVLFNNASINLDWSQSDYDEIPDVKFNRLDEERRRKWESMDDYSRVNASPMSKKSFGIAPFLLKPVPEVLLLGNTNVGKSTLVNTLFLDRMKNKSTNDTTEYAYVSRRAGYTKSLNGFGVNNKFRIVDTPGYGQFGEQHHGDAVIEYIEKRSTLRNVFILIDGLSGFQDNDYAILDLLSSQGIPTDVIFTKIDQVYKKYTPKKMVFSANPSISERESNKEYAKEANVKILHHFQRSIEKSGILDFPTNPRVFFNNALVNPMVTKRYGYKEIRLAILQSCGLL